MSGNQHKRFNVYMVMKKYPDFTAFIKSELQKQMFKRIEEENSKSLLTGKPALQGIKSLTCNAQ